MKRTVVALGAVAGLVAGVVLLASGAVASRSDNDPPIVRAAKGELRPAVLNAGGVARTMPFFSAGTIAAAQSALGGLGDEHWEAADAGAITSDADIGAADLGVTKGTVGCAARDGHKGNVRVNQDCSFRRQAEEDIAYNFADRSNLLAGTNDSRMGFNQCWFEFSTNSGRNWGEIAPPFRQHLNSPELDEDNTITGQPGTFHTYDADSDPSMAFDSQGRGFISCVSFDIASFASMAWVSNSPKGAQGAFFFNIPQTGPRFIVAEDNDITVAHDKQFVIADHWKQSPNTDNVYLTWTVFRFDEDGNYLSSPIYGSMSTDHARSWSKPEEISGNNRNLCFFGDAFDPKRDPHDCDFNQGSDPAVLPNGDLVVVFNNGNTPAGNPNGQQLAVVCHPSGDSTKPSARLHCASPRKVGDDIIVGEPLCDFGRGPEECVPGPFIRTNDYPRISTNTSGKTVYVTWQDYRNGEYDIQVTRSTDGGKTWEESETANPDTGLDHYMPAIDAAPQDIRRVGASWFRSERVPNENTTPEGGFALGMPGVGEGDSDYVVAGGRDLTTPYDFNVVSPVFPPPDGVQLGFNGDYSGLVISEGQDCHPIWSDTRNADPFAPANGVTHDEDAFTTKVTCPNGTGKVGPGTIGKG